MKAHEQQTFIQISIYGIIAHTPICEYCEWIIWNNVYLRYFSANSLPWHIWLALMVAVWLSFPIRFHDIQASCSNSPHSIMRGELSWGTVVQPLIIWFVVRSLIWLDKCDAFHWPFDFKQKFSPLLLQDTFFWSYVNHINKFRLVYYYLFFSHNTSLHSPHSLKLLSIQLLLVCVCVVFNIITFYWFAPVDNGSQSRLTNLNCLQKKPQIAIESSMHRIKVRAYKKGKKKPYRNAGKIFDASVLLCLFHFLSFVLLFQIVTQYFSCCRSNDLWQLSIFTPICL